MKREREELAKLALIAADPFASEEEWLPACSAAGNKSLVCVEGMSGRNVLATLARVVAVLAIGTSNIAAIWILLHASLPLLQMIGLINFVPLDSLAFPPFVQRLTLIFVTLGSLGFWLNFAFKNFRPRSLLLVTWLSLTTFVFAAQPSFNNAALAYAGLLAFYIFSRLGREVTRKLTQKQVDSVLKFAGALAVLPSLVMLLMNLSLNTSLSPIFTVICSSLLSPLFMVCGPLAFHVFLAATLSGPILAAGRLPKSGGMQERFSIGLLFVAPVIVAELVSILVPALALAYFAFCGVLGAEVASRMQELPAMLIAILELVLVLCTVLTITVAHRVIGGLFVLAKDSLEEDLVISSDKCAISKSVLK